MRTLLASALAGTALLSAISFSAQALPATAPHATAGTADVILVEGGCGIGWHRGPFGGCRRGGGVVVVPGAVVVEPVAPVVAAPVVVVPRRCPLGTHWGPYRHACVLN